MLRIWLHIAFGIVTFLLLTQCDTDPNADIQDIELEIDFSRADSVMWEASAALQENPDMAPMEVYDKFLIHEKGFLGEWVDVRRFLPPNLQNTPKADTFIARTLVPILADSNLFMLLDTVRKVFPYDYPFKERITPALKRLVKYIPDVQIPAYRTHVNGFVAHGDMRQVDQIVFLPVPDSPGYFTFGLHYFLGAKLPYYPANIPQYQKNRFSEEYLEVLMVESIANGMVPEVSPSQQPTLLDRIIHAGIKQYFVQQILPNTPDTLCLKYTEKQLYWADLYEARIYKELMDDLFDTNFMAHRDYIMDKPYTTSLAQESAPRLGEYLGWKIVSNYMDRHSEVTLDELIETTDYEMIFREARYKPVPK